MADDADQPLPRLTLFVAQRPADVGEHQQLVRTPFLTEGGAAHFVAARSAGEGDVLDARREPFETGPQSELGRGAAEDLLGGLRQQALAGAVDQPQRLRRRRT